MAQITIYFNFEMCKVQKTSKTQWSNRSEPDTVLKRSENLPLTIKKEEERDLKIPGSFSHTSFMNNSEQARNIVHAEVEQTYLALMLPINCNWKQIKLGV